MMKPKKKMKKKRKKKKENNKQCTRGLQKDLCVSKTQLDKIKAKEQNISFVILALNT